MLSVVIDSEVDVYERFGLRSMVNGGLPIIKFRDGLDFEFLSDFCSSITLVITKGTSLPVFEEICYLFRACSEVNFVVWKASLFNQMQSMLVQGNLNLGAVRIYGYNIEVSEPRLVERATEFFL